MKDFNDIQNLWKEQTPAQLPDVNSILADAKKVQRDLNTKIITQVIILVAVVIFIIVLINIIPFQQVTTFVGIGLMAGTILLFSAVRLYQVVEMKKMDLTQNPRHLLVNLHRYYRFQNTVNTRYTLLYFILMNVAFALYFIEVLQPVPLLYQIIIVLIYLAWMLFAFLYLGKKHKLKEQAKTQSIIDAIRTIEEHYES